MPLTALNVCRSIFPGQAIEVGGHLSPISGANPLGVLGTDWAILMGLAMMVSLSILVLVYFAANFLRSQPLLAWTKFELFQIIGTAVIVIFCTAAIVGGMCTFDMSFLDRSASSTYYDHATGRGFNMYEISQNYFDRVEGLGNVVFAYMVFAVKQVNFISKVSWPSHPLGVGSVNNPLESLTQINTLFFVMVSGYIISYLLLQLQMRMLEYLAIASLKFFLPFGILFRSFEPTRAFGGTLIALSIALFLFYPIIMVFNDYLVTRSFQIDGTQTEVEGHLDAAGQLAADGDTATGENVRGQPEELGDRQTQEGLVSGISSGIFVLIKPLMLYVIAAVILPVLNFTILVEITRGITHTFGEEVDVSNLTRLI